MNFLTNDFLNTIKRLDNLGFTSRMMDDFYGSSDCERAVNADGQTIYIRVPGYTREDLNVEVHNGMLRVYGSMAEDKRVTRLIPSELDYHFTVGGSYRIEEASLRDGLLYIHLSKTSQPEGTKIPIS